MVRPAQPPMADRKTGDAVDLLFACRGHGMVNTYINAAIIPMLCRKAGVAPSAVRGRITSHRARATIASQLYNAKEPMTLFELQARLGHRSPATTQHYAQITPNTLIKAYTDAGYFARNVRTIEVLIDRGAVVSGAATTGAPWQHYDLGHGYCSYTFFEQCPHPKGTRSVKMPSYLASSASSQCRPRRQAPACRLPHPSQVAAVGRVHAGASNACSQSAP